MDFYLGQIGIYGFNFAPKGWALCAGSLLSISQNTALFSLIGTTYGGDGQVTFALPDLRSRAAMGVGPLTAMGEESGTETVTLINPEMPAHNHLMLVSSAPATVKVTSNHVFAAASDGTNAFLGYAPLGSPVVLNPMTVSLTGGSQPHPNIQPCLAVNFCIATTGIYPSRN